MRLVRRVALGPAWRRRAVPWIGAAIIGVIVALAAFDIVRTYNQAVEDTARDLETQARIIAEQTARTVQAVDVVLRHIAAEYQRARLAKLAPDELNGYLRDQAVGLIQVDGFVLADAQGDVRAVSWLEPGSPQSVHSIAQIPGFAQLRDDPTIELGIGEAAYKPGDGQWMIPLGRSLRTSAGKFAGVIGAGMRVGYYEDFYRNLRPERGTRIALLHARGSMLAPRPPDGGSPEQPMPRFDSLLARAAAGELAPMRITGADGIERFATIHLVADYPLAVMVTREAEVALAPWRSQALGTALRTVVLAALAATFLVLLTRKLARLQTAQASLSAIKERFALAVSGSDDGIWDWDQKTDLVFASARARELYGLPPGTEVQSKDAWFRLVQVHPDDAERRGAAMKAHMEGRTPLFETEYRVRHLDGNYRWVRVRGLAVRDAEGRPLRIAGSVSDIDARKRAEEALRQSEERYELAVAGVNHGVWDWDLASDMVFMSARAQELFGREAGEPMRPRRQWIAQWTYHPDDRALVRATLSDYLRGGTKTFEVEYRMRHLNGEWRWYHDRGIAVRDASGRAYRMAGSIEDITDRKRAEAERDRLEEQLRQTQRLEAMGTLAGGVAHDFNNILAAILGYGEMAQKEAAEHTPLRRYIDAAMSAGARAKALVERILAFSRSGMGELVPVHVQAVITEVLEIVAGSLPAGIRLERTLAAGDAGVIGDPTQLHQVVMNLCSNAVQAIKGEGTVTVSVDTIEFDAPRTVTTCALRAGAYVRLRVADTGTGIDPRVIDRIFDPFFTTKEVGVGTGLGLSLAHGIVSDLGGGIDVESPPGAGATFTVYVPWQCTVMAPAKVEEPTAAGAGETIMLVDDEVALVRLGEEMMADLGYDAVGISSSAEALELFRAEPDRFDAVLSDEAMPGMTGSELTAEIRKIRPDIPVVLMSGYVTPALSERARDAGVFEVLAKPLVSREIARSLASALRS
ncbi:MAG TPA: PAS domain-containing protein [Burkholderiaceae bacterium]|nr:PAS domain-containing protein [Burkholderiaceae bacterium]